MAQERWSAAAQYEPFMGRWSRALADAALAWLEPAPGERWVDVGCGTGSVSEAVLTGAKPSSLLGVDPSEAYVAAARSRLPDPRARFEVADAGSLPLPDGSVDHVVSGLVLNFVPDSVAALREMRRVVAPGGRVSGWVWDYAEGMQMLRVFWDGVIAEHPASAELDEAARFPTAQEGVLADQLVATGLDQVRAGAVEMPMTFAGFDDYWQPFLGGQGPASAYLLSLPAERLEALRTMLQARLPVSDDGTIRLTGRAWIATGRAPG